MFLTENATETQPAGQWLVAIPSAQGGLEQPVQPGWSAINPLDVTTHATFSSELSGDQATVAIVRTVSVGEHRIAQLVVWSGSYGSTDEAELRHQWLVSNPSICTRLGTFAALFGPDEVTSEIEVAAVEERIRSAKQKEYDIKMAEVTHRLAEEKAETAKRILIYHLKEKGQYGWALQRGNATDPFFTILFRMKWERDRFHDWAKYQNHQFSDWAVTLETCPANAFERLLLRQMLEAERREKALKDEGLAVGGHRPLRFWRGEA